MCAPFDKTCDVITCVDLQILKLPVDEIKRWIDEAPQYRLLVENVPYSISRDSATLKKAFEEDSEEFGADSIARVRVLLKTGKDKIEPRGMAYIMFRNKPAFEAALARDYTDLVRATCSSQITVADAMALQSKKYGDGSRPDKPAGRVWTVRPTPARPAKDSKPPRSRAACGAGAGAEDSTGSEAEEATAAEGK